MKVSGACHCGKIQIEAVLIEGKVFACHCTDCQTFAKVWQSVQWQAKTLPSMRTASI